MNATYQFRKIQKNNNKQSFSQKNEQQNNKQSSQKQDLNSSQNGQLGNKICNDEYQLQKNYQQIHKQQNIKKQNDQFQNNARISRSTSKNMEQKVSDKSQLNNLYKIKTIKKEFTFVKENPQFEAFKLQGYDIVDVQNNDEYEKLLIFTDILFYYKKNQQVITNPQQSQQGLYKVRGKLYQTSYDQNQNPKFIIQEGEFLVDIKNNSFILDGEGIEYQGKSNQIKNKGEYKKGVYLQKYPQCQKKSEYKSYSVEPKRIKILEIADVQAIQIKINNEKKNIWCKYNQQFSQRDLNILNSQMWVNSSMIDCYVLYLNKQSQEQYFKKNQQERQYIRKIFFVTSNLITNFGQNYNIEKSSELFQQHFLELQEIKYDIQTMYSKIGFPIHQINHWYFLLFDLQQKKVEIFDSLKYNSKFTNPLITHISELLMLKDPQISQNKNYGQQQDGYSCGYHVCQFMKFCQEAQFSNKSNYQYNQQEMKNILRNLINDGDE